MPSFATKRIIASRLSSSHEGYGTLERGSGRLLGAQIVGGQGAGKRIDVLATALWNHMRVDELMQLDLAYAPPFAPVWDPVLIAARKAWETSQ